MSSETYQKAFKYEMLIRNAFNCPSGMKNGAHQCFMQNAMTMEEGKTFVKHLGSLQKQFEDVKKHISNALIKLAKTKAYSNFSSYFEEQLLHLDDTTTTDELMQIVEQSLDKVILCKKVKV